MEIVWIIVACMMSGLTHAIRDTLHHHWETSIFAKYGNDSFWGPASRVWLRRYERKEDGTIDPDRRKWPPILDGIKDGWHLVTSIQYGIWVTLAVYLAGLPWWSILPFWAVGQAVMALFYDRLLRTNR